MDISIMLFVSFDSLAVFSSQHSDMCENNVLTCFVGGESCQQKAGQTVGGAWN